MKRTLSPKSLSNWLNLLYDVKDKYKYNKYESVAQLQDKHGVCHIAETVFAFVKEEILACTTLADYENCIYHILQLNRERRELQRNAKKNKVLAEVAIVDAEPNLFNQNISVSKEQIDVIINDLKNKLYELHNINCEEPR